MEHKERLEKVWKLLGSNVAPLQTPKWSRVHKYYSQGAKAPRRQGAFCVVPLEAFEAAGAHVFALRMGAQLQF